MGMFSGGDDDGDAQSQNDSAMQAQIAQNNQIIAQKNSALYQQRIAIIKDTGQPDFSGSKANAPIVGKP